MRFSSGGNEHSAAPTDAEWSAPTPALPTSHLLSWPLAQGNATSWTTSRVGRQST